MDEKDVKIQELNSKVEELSTKVNELNNTIVEVNKTLETKNTELNSATEELGKLRQFKEQKDLEEKKLEVNSYFENEVKKNGFTEVELNSLKEQYVEKIDLEGLKNAEADLCVKKIKELNSKQIKNEVNSINDLFMPIHNEEKNSQDDYSDLI